MKVTASHALLLCALTGAPAFSQEGIPEENFPKSNADNADILRRAVEVGVGAGELATLGWLLARIQKYSPLTPQQREQVAILSAEETLAFAKLKRAQPELKSAQELSDLMQNSLRVEIEQWRTTTEAKLKAAKTLDDLAPIAAERNMVSSLMKENLTMALFANDSPLRQHLIQLEPKLEVDFRTLDAKVRMGLARAGVENSLLLEIVHLRQRQWRQTEAYLEQWSSTFLTKGRGLLFLKSLALVGITFDVFCKIASFISTGRDPGFVGLDNFPDVRFGIKQMQDWDSAE